MSDARTRAGEIMKLAGQMTTAAREAIRTRSGLTGDALHNALDAIDIFTFEDIAKKCIARK